MSGLALGLDLGTSGVRSAVLDAAGEIVAEARADYPPDGAATADGWWAGAEACLDAQVEALRAAGRDPREIAGLAVDGTSGSLVLTDAGLRPVTRALMYSDGGFDDEAALIARTAPDPHVARGPAGALARALALVAEDRDGRAAHLLHQADLIAARLTGVGGRTDHNNALKTGLDPATGRWPDWIDALPLPRRLLPEAHAPGTPLGPLAPAIARRFGLDASARVHAGTTDSIAAFLACRGAPGTAVTSLGTTLAVKLASQVRIDAPELGLYAHRLGGGWLVGGASNTGGGVIRALFDDAARDRAMARIDPNVESPLDYYPLLRPGERFPVNDPALAPRIEPRPSDDAAFLHGLLEGIARIERRAYEVMAGRGAPVPSRVLTAGGGGRSEVWTAIRARVLGVPVAPAPRAEAAIGAATLAMGEA